MSHRGKEPGHGSSGKNSTRTCVCVWSSQHCRNCYALLINARAAGFWFIYLGVLFNLTTCDKSAEFKATHSDRLQLFFLSVGLQQQQRHSGSRRAAACEPPAARGTEPAAGEQAELHTSGQETSLTQRGVQMWRCPGTTPRNKIS